jgi:dynein heavy chain
MNTSLLFLQEYFHMVNQFLRLEKIEFSGVRGQMLSDLVAEMFTEFTDKSNQFQGAAKDPLNIADTVSQSLVMCV